MLSGQLALLVIFGYLLIRATDRLVSELRDLSHVTKIGKFGLTAFLLAFATSLPELVVGIASALEGRPSLSLGNVLGSNIANISLVVGGTAIVGGSVKVMGEFLRKDLFSAFLAGSLPLLLLMDSRLSRTDALVLFAVYLWFTTTALRQKSDDLAHFQESGTPLWHRVLLKFSQRAARRHIVYMFFWILVLVFSAEVLVKVSLTLAGAMGIPVILMGLFFISIGTTLPEFAFEVRAIRAGEPAMIFGNLLGSIVANSTLIIGMVALIRPITLDGGFKPYLVATVAFVVIFGLFWMFVASKRLLERWEGVLLFLVYILFAVFEFSRINGYDLARVLQRLFLVE